MNHRLQQVVKERVSKVKELTLAYCVIFYEIRILWGTFRVTSRVVHLHEARVTFETLIIIRSVAGVAGRVASNALIVL